MDLFLIFIFIKISKPKQSLEHQKAILFIIGKPSNDNLSNFLNDLFSCGIIIFTKNSLGL